MDGIRAFVKMYPTSSFVPFASFCFHSAFREYGWQFFRRVIAPHPVKTARAFLRTRAIDASRDMIPVSGPWSGGARSIVGVGFCLKPLDPPCPSGHANHDCHYLKHLVLPESPHIPPACRNCLIREFGTLTLKTGSAFYIMTSAQDILFDVFDPSLREGRFGFGLFLLCRYSLRPFAVGMLAAGIQGAMFPFAEGDCRDYKTWLQADVGIKSEQTTILDSTRAGMRVMLSSAVRETACEVRFEKEGNVFFSG